MWHAVPEEVGDMHKIDSIVRQTAQLQRFGMLFRKKWTPSEAVSFTFRRFLACMKDAIALLEDWACSAISEDVDTSSWWPDNC
jgi:hypothetical protein